MELLPQVATERTSERDEEGPVASHDWRRHEEDSVGVSGNPQTMESGPSDKRCAYHLKEKHKGLYIGTNCPVIHA